MCLNILDKQKRTFFYRWFHDEAPVAPPCACRAAFVMVDGERPSGVGAYRIPSSCRLIVLYLSSMTQLRNQMNKSSSDADVNSQADIAPLGSLHRCRP